MAFKARGRLGSVPPGPGPEERLQQLNKAIQAITTDDVSTVLSCIPGNIEVGAVYDLVLGVRAGCPRKVKASLLHLAIHHQAQHCTKLLLHLGAQTEASESELGDTGLHAAVRVGDFDLVSLLLEYGASATSLNAARDTPLHLAAERGMVHVVTMLLQAGAEPVVRNRYEETPWDTAMLAGSPSSVLCADLILTQHLKNREAQGLPVV